MGIELDGANHKLKLDNDGDTYLEANTDDIIKVYLAGAEDLRIGANAINVLSGTTLTIDSGATLANSGTISGFGGITAADQWRQTATTSSTSGATVTANWEQADTDGFGALGSSMTESSGTFTFPSTGYWLIMWHGSCKASGGAVNSFGFELRTTTNNSTYSSAATGSGSGAADDYFANVACFHLFDVTSTTNCKVQMYYNSSATGIYQADTDRSVNALTFIRLADT